MHKKRGLSLIELLVVIFFMSIVLTMTISLGRNVTQKSYFSEALNTFVADFAYAKQMAARENRFILIDFDADGRSYNLMRQTTIGDVNNWNQVKTVRAMEGKVFFDGVGMQDFVVNSMGEVYDFPLGANPQPTQVILGFFVKDASGSVDYQATVNIYGYGGIKVEE